MKVDWDQSVAGTDPLEIRNVIARASSKGRCPFTLHEIATALAGYACGSHRHVWKKDIDLQATRAEHLLGVMVASGLVRIARTAYGPDDAEQDYAFSVNSTGRSLLAADKRKRMSRKTADALLREVMDATLAVNADRTQMMTFARLAVYGSYLSDRMDLGDLDIAFELVQRRDPDDDDGCNRRRAMLFERHHPAPVSRSIENRRWYEYDWDRAVPLRTIRVSRSVSLSEVSVLDRLGCAYVDLLPERREVEASPDWRPIDPFRGLVDDGGAALEAMRSETGRLIRDDPRYRIGSGVRHSDED